MASKSPVAFGSTQNALVSSLISAVLDFWSLLLRQDSLILLPETESSTSDYTDQMAEDDDGSSPKDVEMDSVVHSVDSPSASDMTRFLLNEERDRLCLWKFNFTDEDLDFLTEKVPNVFGGAVVQCFVSIGEALSTKTGNVQDFIFWAPVQECGKHGNILLYQDTQYTIGLLLD